MTCILAPTLGIVGLGWLGGALATKMHGQFKTWGTTRSASRAAQLKDSFVTSLVYSSTDDLLRSLKISPSTSHLVLTLPPSVGSEKQSYAQCLSEVVKKITPSDLVVLTSSISVYGETQGQVNEDSPCVPSSDSGSAILAAESVVQNLDCRRKVILRLAGLIGPDRHPIGHLSGRKQRTNGSEPINLIHKSDVLFALEKSLVDESVNGVYNVVSPDHRTKQDFYSLAAQDAGLLPPLYDVSSKERVDKRVTSHRDLFPTDYAFASLGRI